MKNYLLKLLIGCLFLLSMPCYGQTDFQTKYFKNGMYSFDSLQTIKESELFTTYKSEFGLSNEDEMRQTNSQILEDGTFRSKYELYHEGVRVQGSMMNVIGDKGVVEYAMGFLMPNLNIDTNGLISMDEAIASAIAYLGADKYTWEDTTISDSSNYAYPNYAELIITHKSGTSDSEANNYALCYEIQLASIEPQGIHNVFINAHTGVGFTIQNARNDAHSVDNGHICTWYDACHSNLTTTTCNTCFSYWLYDMERNIRTTYKGANHDIKDGDNDWGSTDEEKTAATAQWCVERAWDYFANTFYKEGTNDQYNYIKVLCEDPTVSFGEVAGYNGSLSNSTDYITLASNNTNYTSGVDGYSSAMLDVLGHEYTHGMILRSSELGTLSPPNAPDESDALNEGYADIFGQMVESYTMGANDWISGDHSVSGGRHFDNPHLDNPPSPAIYHESGYWNWNNESHINGGILRKWFYLLSNGGTFNGVTVQGIGVATAARVAYTTFTWWLWSNVTYPQAALQTSAETIADFGGMCSNVHLQTVNALDAVGLHVPIPDCFNHLILNGPRVISTVKSAQAKKIWVADIENISKKNGTYQWMVPEGWNAHINGDSLVVNTLSDFDNYNSVSLKVTYNTQDGQHYDASQAVHFSDLDWKSTEPTDSAVAQSYMSNRKSISKNMVLYPNPAVNQACVLIPEITDNSSLSIIDMNGRMVKKIDLHSPKVNIDLSNLQNGIYIIRVQTSRDVFIQKISIVH